MKTEPVMQPQAQECGRPLEPGEGKNDSCRAPRGSTALPDFALLVSRTVRKYISVVLSHPACGDLLWRPWETNAARLFCISDSHRGGIPAVEKALDSSSG